MITVIGMGAAAGDLTANGERAIRKIKCVVFKTAKSAAGKALKTELSLINPLKSAAEQLEESVFIACLDEVFDSAADFDDLNKKIVERLCAFEEIHGEVAFLVDGDGYSDSTVVELSARADIALCIIGGVSLSPRKPALSVTSLCAYDLARAPYIDSALPLSIYGMDNKELAGEVKLYLMEYYDPETPVTFSHSSGEISVPLCDIDRQMCYNYLTGVYLPPQCGFDKPRHTFGDLKRLIERLTAPDGCPWDREQTHSAIRINMLEEAYEAVDAITDDDIAAMEEELGDVMLQTVLHSDIARRTGEFTIGDCITRLCVKLFSRHTHIFGQKSASDAGDALNNWEEAKAKEKDSATLARKLELIPQSFPALLRLQKVVSKLKKAGYEFDTAAAVKELSELLSATSGGDAKCRNFGQILFLATVLVCQDGGDAEVLLLEAIGMLEDAAVSSSPALDSRFHFGKK